MRTKQLFLFAITCIVISTYTLKAQAEDYHISLNETPTKGSGIFDGVKNGDRAVVNLTQNRSYCCSVRTPTFTAETEAGISSVVSHVSGEALQIEKNSAVTPAISFGDRSARVCFTSNRQNDYVIKTAPFYVHLAIPNESADNVKVQCDDTTLFGGFNTFASEFVFLEISNTSELDNFGSAQRVVTVTALDTNGTEIFSIPVAVNSRADVDIHSRVGADRIGTIRVNHTAPHGAIHASVAEYKSDKESKSGLTLLGRQELSVR